MKAILQRVLSASVTVEKEAVSSIGKGVLVFAAVAPGDTEKEADSLAAKVLKLKLWDDNAGGRWKKSVMDIGGEVLCGKVLGFPCKSNWHRLMMTSQCPNLLYLPRLRRATSPTSMELWEGRRPRGFMTTFSKKSNKATKPARLKTECFRP
ncbi:deacylase [Daldinia sp. FL1419]|nr:deacylase [Daldinia sp. FL1419]